MNQHIDRKDFLNILGLTMVTGIVSSHLFSRRFSDYVYQDGTLNPSKTTGPLNNAIECDDTHLLRKQLSAKPNIVVIVADNHHYEAMGCAGHPFIQTPGLDKLAQDGILFENTFCPTPLCSPSRVSILTGVYAHNHGIVNNHSPWTGQNETFLEYLSREGYKTAFIGKWHMPGKGLPDLPFLDLFVSYTYREGQGTYVNCPLIVNGEDVPSRKAYISEEITDYAIEFLQHHKAQETGDQQPFCLILAHRAAHAPYKVPEDIRGLYDNQNVKEVLPDLIDPWWYGKANGNIFQGVMMGSYYNQYRKYCETLTAMDFEILRLLDEIERLALEENTMVIYLGDNGMQWGTHNCHGIREPYEDSIRLPLIVRIPWLNDLSGVKRNQMALNIDIGPTILDAVGLKIPQEMDGHSLLPIIINQNQPGRKDFSLEFWRYFPENTPSYRGIRTENYKLIQFERGRDPWLFDLRNDPAETINLYNTENGKAILKELEI